MRFRRDMGYSTTWYGRLGWRVITVLDVILMTALLPVSVLWYGLPVLAEYPGHFHRAWKSLRTGHAGPYRGIVW